jgi:hypothetical protein
MRWSLGWPRSNISHGIPNRQFAADRGQRSETARAAAEGTLIGIVPLNSSRRVRAGRRLICIISNAETADTPDSGQALLKSDEATIHGTIWSPRIFRTPGIVLGLSAISDAEDTDANCKHEQQEPDRRLLMCRNIYVLCCRPLRNEPRRIAANVAKLPDLGGKD